jgi:asparagine synthase (glutamine-hydrolysing)
MCGITGGVWFDPQLVIDLATLRRMTELLTHRGPDDAGEYRHELQASGPGNSPGVAMGVRRLSIIDVAGGHQPISNEDASVWIAFNGEVYNFRDLRHRLEAAGHTFRTDSDTETLVHLYEDEGVAFVDHLVGMFAIAVWDSREKRLLLVRDRLGQKPLYYRAESGRLIFASELKSILAVEGVERSLDPLGLDAYLLYQYVPHPGTIYRGINKLPPGHFAVYESDRLSVRPYWSPSWDREVARSDEEYAERLRAALATSVRLRLQSDVPLGAFLSGGVDSALIVGLMQQSSSSRVKTFTIGFGPRDYDESSLARETAQRLGSEHHEYRVEPNAIEVLPKLAWHFDEPFGDSSAIPTWQLAEFARKQVTVALSGDGGDELFAGYPRYRGVWLGSFADRIPGSVRRILFGRWWNWLPGRSHQKSLMRRLKRLMDGLRGDPRARYLEWVSIFNESRRGQLYAADFLTSLPPMDPAQFLYRAMNIAGHRDSVSQASIADLMTYLPCDLMTKVDMATMAHGLECRQPFLDHRVVELAVAMPAGTKFRFGRGKRILKKAFPDLLPSSLMRRPKRGFGVPLEHWFRNELKDYSRELLLSRAAIERGYIDPRAVTRLWNEHVSGRFDHAYRLWSLVMLEQWFRTWMDAS